MNKLLTVNAILDTNESERADEKRKYNITKQDGEWVRDRECERGMMCDHNI